MELKTSIMKTSSEMTDREIQEAMLENIRITTEKTRSIYMWTAFFGWITIVGIIVGVIALMESIY